jgi:hypothetical protein
MCNLGIRVGSQIFLFVEKNVFTYDRQYTETVILHEQV